MAPAPWFALGTFADGPRTFPGLVVGDGVVDLSPAPDVRSLLDSWPEALPMLRARAGSTAGRHPLAELTVRPPVQPRQVIQAGANYRTHVVELAVRHNVDDRPEDEVRSAVAAAMDRSAECGTPYLFTGLPSAIAGPYDDVVLPSGSDQHDWELELAVVIGRPTYHVTRDAALDHVAGYTIANDLTTRDLVFRRDFPALGTDWFRAKNAPGFLPVGPFIVPAEFVGDPMDLRLTLTLNGEVMQNESTKDMIFDVSTLVQHAARTARLWPGDLLLTGSPAGNGLVHGRMLRPGDVMEATITGLGRQRTRCVEP
jgi:2-keto-4-pentenoate hydratase/2-oxohepta-3-ene-1,7-dioic acid hydratase in catechol pathway